MLEAITIIMSMILVNNYVLAQFLGICPFLGVSKKTGFRGRYGYRRYLCNGACDNRDLANSAGFKQI